MLSQPRSNACHQKSKKEIREMSENKKTSVLGIYTNRETVERATDTLIKSGFPASVISVLLPENLGAKPLGTEKATKAPEGATTGATSGAVVPHQNSGSTELHAFNNVTGLCASC
jgi:hypothetical protein